MTKVSFLFKEGNIISFKVSNHTGYAGKGSDIVCAGITSAVRLAECCLDDVLKIDAEVLMDEDNAEIEIKLPENLTEDNNKICQAVLTALRLHLKELAQEYPKFIEVMEV